MTRTWMLKNGPVLHHVRMPDNASETEVRAKALQELNSCPGVFCAGTGIAPYEYESLLKQATVHLTMDGMH